MVRNRRLLPLLGDVLLLVVAVAVLAVVDAAAGLVMPANMADEATWFTSRAVFPG